MKEIITNTKGNAEGTINSLIEFLQDSKLKGATHYRMDWSHDPQWSFKWFETYRVKTLEEIKNEEIEKLENRLSELRNME